MGVDTLCLYYPFLFWILWLAGLGGLGSKIQNLMGSSSTRFVKRAYLCDPDYEMMGIFVSPIKKNEWESE